MATVGDVSQAADAERMVAEAVRNLGRLDILVNNAGIQPVDWYFRVEDTPEEVWDRILGVNLKGGFLCAQAAARHNVPVIADGGIRFSGDITKAIAVGAATTMIGNLFAGTDERPGEMIIYQGRQFKEYRGMGSIGAMRRGSRDRYFQDAFDLEGPSGAEKLVPEGIEGRVAHKGSVAAMVHQLVGGLRAGMGYCGCGSIPDLQRSARMRFRR